MKKKLINLLLVLCMAFALMGFIGCGEKGEKGDQGITGATGVGIQSIEKIGTENLTDTYKILYTDGNSTTFTVTNGANGTNGENGSNGQDGVSVTNATINADGELVLTFSKGEPLNLGKIVGTDGDDGDDGVGIENVTLSATGDLAVKLTSGTTLELGNIKGQKGDDGVSVSKTEINEKGELVITLSNGSSTNLGNVIGAKGDTGVGIGKIELSDSYELTIYLTDDSILPLGNIRGEKGENGKSAYELYKEKYSYSGTEEEWLIDLVNGQLAIAQKHEITFDTQGGAPVPTKQEIAHGEKLARPNDPIKEGYIFDGWYVDGEKWSFVGYVVTENMTLTAQWKQEITECVITRANGFDMETEGGVTTLTKYVANSMESYDFASDIQVSTGCTWGLFADSSATKEYALKSMQISEGDNIVYIVVFHSDGIRYTQYAVNIHRQYIFTYTLVNEGLTIKNGEIEENTTLALPTEIPEKEHYDFSHWEVNGEKVAFPYLVKENALIFTAAFTPTVYNITYQCNGGEFSAPYTQEYNVEQTVTLSAPERAGYTFNGWYDNAELLGEPITEISVGSFGDKTYYADWTPNTYTVTYNTNGGVEVEQSLTQFNTAQLPVTLSLEETHKDDAIFDGWYFDESLTIPATQITEIGNVTLYANWINASEGLEYTLSSDSTYYSITGYTGTDTDVIICDYHAGLPVAKIGANAFQDKTKVFSVRFPYTLTEIGNSAFSGCTRLATVNIPNNVVAMGSSAFYNCSSLTGVYITNIASWCNITFGNATANPLYYARNLYVNNELITDLIIPNSVTSIGAYAFYNYDNLTAITFPDSIQSIESYAFYDCDGLTALNFPDSLHTIEQYAFNGCDNENLTTILIPDNVVSIGDSALGYSTFGYSHLTLCCEVAEKPSGWHSRWDSGQVVVWNVKELHIDDQGVIYALHNTNSATVVGCRNGITTAIVPSTINGYIVESMAERVFRDCNNLTSIVIPDSITSISEEAFEHCSSLTSIVIPDSITSIGSSAFSGCSSLTSIVIPDSVTKIGGYAFSGCSSLTSIVIPDSVTTIGSGVFAYCSSLTRIDLPDGVTSIDSYAFSGCSSLTSIVIPDSVTKIGEKAFYDCSSLKNIVLPNSVTSIGKQAFYGCKNLQYIFIPETVTNIKEGTFYSQYSGFVIYCESVNGPSGSDMRWNYAGEYSDTPYSVVYNVKEMYADEQGVVYALLYSNTAIVAGYDGTKTEIVIPSEINGCTVQSIAEGAFYNCSSLGSVTILDSVTTIGSSAFYNCSSLTSIEIPDSVTSIGSSAFSGCSSLTKVNYLGTIDDWAMIGFGSDNANPLCYAKKLYINGIEVTEVVLTTATKIGAYAFYNCSSLTSIEIPDSVTKIGGYAFYNCSSLTSIEIPDGVTSIGSYAFSYCSSLVYNQYDNAYYLGNKSNPYVALIRAKDTTTCIISENTKCIASGAFNERRSLTSIEIPDGVTSIGSSAFSGCSSLTSIVIPDSVTSIGLYAFEDCSNLTSIIIPNSVTYIGWQAFRYNSRLTIYCEAASEPSGWSYQWNYDDRPVKWGYTDS